MTRALLLAYFDLALAVNQRFRRPETHTGRTMRKFAIRFAEHHPEAYRVRTRFVQITSTDERRSVVDEFYGPAWNPDQRFGTKRKLFA